MIGSRIFGISWFLLALAYCIASDSWLAPVILALSVGFFLYLGVNVLITGRFLKFSFIIDEEVMKKQSASCIMEIQNLCVLPLYKASVRILFHNVLTDDEKKSDFTVSIPGRGKESVAWQFKSKYVGKNDISIDHIFIYDFLGIFRKRVPVSLKKSIYVTPETFSSAVDISNRNAPNMDSDYYSDTKKGFDSGETFGIREYIPGDSTKFIHWKLSSKLDKILIRELGFPIQNSILLLLETGWQKEPFSPSGTDAMVEAFISLSQSLCDCGMEHHVCWFDHGEARLMDYEITDRESINSVMKAVLSSPASQDELSVISHYVEDFRDFQAAHIVYITCFVNPEELRPLLSHCCLTVLKSVSEDSSSEEEYLPSGITLIPFYEETIREDLYQLDI